MPKIYLYLIFFLLITPILSSSYQAHARQVITGTVLDSETGDPMEFAQAALLNPVDSAMVEGGITDQQGEFRLEAPETGEYLLSIRFVGYHEGLHMVTISEETSELGTFVLESAATELGEIEVSAAAALFRTEADRRVFNVERMTVAEGGTTIQLLESLPSVQVDEEGNVSLRGSGNILIYVNGRPISLFSDDTESVLEQYPASAVEEVELITNPSSRYEAEGVGGIINIILKEERSRHGVLTDE